MAPRTATKGKRSQPAHGSIYKVLVKKDASHPQLVTSNEPEGLSQGNPPARRYARDRGGSGRPVLYHSVHMNSAPPCLTGTKSTPQIGKTGERPHSSAVRVEEFVESLHSLRPPAPEKNPKQLRAEIRAMPKHLQRAARESLTAVLQSSDDSPDGATSRTADSAGDIEVLRESNASQPEPQQVAYERERVDAVDPRPPQDFKDKLKLLRAGRRRKDRSMLLETQGSEEEPRMAWSQDEAPSRPNGSRQAQDEAADGWGRYGSVGVEQDGELIDHDQDGGSDDGDDTRASSDYDGSRDGVPQPAPRREGTAAQPLASHLPLRRSSGSFACLRQSGCTCPDCSNSGISLTADPGVEEGAMDPPPTRRKQLKFVRRDPSKEAPSGSKPTKKSKWRQQSESFRAVIRVARGASPTAGGTPGANGQEDASVPDFDTVQCPHCSRRFNTHAAERHIPICQSIQAKPSRLVRGQGRTASSLQRGR
jgi:hypothetical protein